MARNWGVLATQNTGDYYTIKWSRYIPTGTSVDTVTYESDPGGLTFSNNVVSSNVSTVSISSNTQEGNYYVKATPALNTGNASAVSIPIVIKKHNNV